ncbi:hypothetical protein [Tahibacter harae]|uniref:Uncharacterized protein n=1 Tax=Tahibacter harae TaxID=2963937 RepID=A0ABT1QQF0_9GAMM|nr:hypothetical protein [Tahibacter harae]MCQ4164524.1 hypothetical protein [Tahibacter harae]
MAQRRFEDRINALSDQDWAWWPLLTLRPPRTQAISEARLLLIALLFGGFCALAGLLLVYLVLGELPPDAGAAVAAACLAVFYLALRFTLFLCWNRRAGRLAAAAAERD